jgi:hypothetical protein
MKLLYLIFYFFLISIKIQAQIETPLYSFFTAGHTYGNPNNVHYGLHYPFVDYIPTINNNSKIELGFLTGDVVAQSTSAYWDSAQIDINKLNMPIYIAAGNHDIGLQFETRFGSYYYSFKKNNDLFIVLTPGLDYWKISGDQLDFLTQTLDSNYASVNNIFIILHELIWWTPENEYSEIIINWLPNYTGLNNYETEIKPLLLSYPNKFTIYAGDLGCTESVSPFMFAQFENITLIASGMGSGNKDNIIITDVFENSIQYNLVAINGDNPNALGILSNLLTNVNANSAQIEFELYPTPPSTDFINLKNLNNSNFKVEIYNLFGDKIYYISLSEFEDKKIDIKNFKSAIYIVKIYNNEEIFTKKFIVN